MNKAIKEITEDIDNFRLNLAMIKIMEYADYLAKQDEISKESLRALVLLMSPVAPHLAEEMWEQLGEKPFACQQKWPEFNEKLIDEKIEESMNVLDKTLSDIRQVLTLTKITEPKKITLFVAEKWKYQLIKKLKAGLTETRDIGALMKKVMDKEHGKDISSLVPKLVKDESKIPAVVLDEKTEFNSLKEAAEKIGREFRCSVEVVKAQDSKENKARQAMPSKPAILVA
jgi:leucyl-tRNA synthetase